MACNCNDGTFYDVTEDSTFTLMARIRHPSTNDLITQANVATLTVSTFDISDPDDVTQVGSDVELDVSEVVFDSPVTSDTRWTDTQDSIGYNFAYPTKLDDADKEYRVDVLFVYTDGSQTKRKWYVRTK